MHLEVGKLSTIRITALSEKIGSLEYGYVDKMKKALLELLVLDGNIK
jgi:hypothetical protein